MDACTHEEADTRVFLHAADWLKQGHKKVIIRTADTNVVVLAISFVEEIKMEELCVAFGTGKYFRYIATHAIASSLAADKSRALPASEWTKDNHGSHYGQHFVRLRTRTTRRCTVAANKTVKQDASVQLPTCHVLPYAALEETAMQTSLMTAFESSSRFCELLQLHFCSSYEFTQSCRNIRLRLLN